MASTEIHIDGETAQQSPSKKMKTRVKEQLSIKKLDYNIEELKKTEKILNNLISALDSKSELIKLLKDEKSKKVEELEEAKRNRSSREEINKLEGEISNLVNTIERETEEQERLKSEEIAARDKYEKDATERAKDIAEATGDTIRKAFDTFLGGLETGIVQAAENFISTQEAMAYALDGYIESNKNYEDYMDEYTQKLYGATIVKQEDVYKNLSSLIQSGITFNAEQRAYLATISEDLGMGFNVQSKELTRLINIQKFDLTSNRMAIQDSLKEFLAQNYKTSQYIKDGFENVSAALFETQSWMAKDNALQLEAVVQQWLGSMNSVGVSTETVNNIANAINLLGSGNITNLSSNNMETLMMLGASQAGLDIGSILNNGISPDDTNKLLAGVTQYLQEAGTRESNIVKSAFAELFGVSMADLRAILNLGTTSPTQSGIITDDIEHLLNKIDGFIQPATKVENLLSNIYFSAGQDLGLGSGGYEWLIYKVLRGVSDMAGDALDGFFPSTAPMGVGIKFSIGDIVKAVPTILLTAGFGIPSLVSNLNNGTSDAYELFNRYRTDKDYQNIVYNTTGDLGNLLKTSGLSTSGSLVISEAGDQEAIASSKEKGNELDEEFMDEGEKEIQETTISDLMKVVAPDGKNYSGPTVIDYLAFFNETIKEVKDFPNKIWQISTDKEYSSVSIGDVSRAGTNIGQSLLDYTIMTFYVISEIKDFLLNPINALNNNYLGAMASDMGINTSDLPDTLLGNSSLNV